MIPHQSYKKITDTIFSVKRIALAFSDKNRAFSELICT